MATNTVSLTMKPQNGSIDLSRTALLIIDMQKDFMEVGGFGESLGNDVTKLQRAVEPCRRLLDAARQRGEMLIIHTREGHRSDLTDVHSHKNKSGVIGSSGPMGKILIRGEPGHDIIETLYPRSGEPIIDKPGKGSFYATDLECILQANNISTLLVCGVTTEVCVHTTVREANDRGYHCIVVEDACASYSDEFHEVALRMIVAQGGIFGSVTTSDDVIAALLNVKKDCDQVLNTLDGQTRCLSATDFISNSRMKKSNAFASRPKYIPGQTPPRP